MKYKNIVNSIIEENSCEISWIGTKYWYNSNGEFHRDNDKPAAIYHNGAKWWYQNGLRHRDNDQPAIIYASGSKEWWLNGKFIKEEL